MPSDGGTSDARMTDVAKTVELVDEEMGAVDEVSSESGPVEAVQETRGKDEVDAARHGNLKEEAYQRRSERAEEEENSAPHFSGGNDAAEGRGDVHWLPGDEER